MICHIGPTHSGSMQYLHFQDELNLHNTMMFTCSHLRLTISIVYLALLPWPPVEGYLGWFYGLGVVNSAALNTDVPVSL